MKRKNCTMLFAAALIASGVTGTQAQDRPQPLPTVAEAHGVFADNSKNSVESIKNAVTAGDWAVPVEVIGCETAGCDGARTPSVYTPLPVSEISGKWNICAVLPHVKDPYWVGQDAGLVDEAKRTGVTLQVFEAGGYTEISKQLNQISNCVASGANAVLVGAVSSDALNPVIEEIAAQGIVVIDYVNGVSSPAVAGRALFEHCTLGGYMGKHLKETGEPVKAVWFPGPAGVSSLETMIRCFKEQAEGGDVEVLGVSYGDTGKDAQLNLIENALSAYPEMNYILGSAVTADAATGPLNERGLTSKVKTASYYFTPEVYAGLENGSITCASAGNDRILSRIAMDMAIRVLEKKPFHGSSYIGMAANVICGKGAGEKNDNLSTLIKELNLPPEGFRPVFSVN
ncbi:hypothetical protein ASC86_22740 [Rhizobium sp. Root1212]|nr:hypothetical protein ASC86_22740 [Rhizobium sp. Root1212]